MKSVNKIINEEINRFLNESFFDENAFVEKRGGGKKFRRIIDKEEDNASKEDSDDSDEKSSKKSSKMADATLMNKLRKQYESEAEFIDLRACVADIYGMDTDTTRSEENVVKLNSKTRYVLAALKGEVREDSGIPYNLPRKVAIKLESMWNANK